MPAKISRKQLDLLDGQLERHTLRPVRAACGHLTELVWRATGRCFACHVAELWAERRAAAIRAEDRRRAKLDTA